MRQKFKFSKKSTVSNQTDKNTCVIIEEIYFKRACFFIQLFIQIFIKNRFDCKLRSTEAAAQVISGSY